LFSADNELLNRERRDPRRESIDLLLTMRSRRQLVATRGNGFGSFPRLWRRDDVPLIACGCDRWAP
jgi:hypothetical protein